MKNDAVDPSGEEAGRNPAAPSEHGGSTPPGGTSNPDLAFERPCKACARNLRFVRSEANPAKLVPLEVLDEYEIKLRFVEDKGVERAVKTGRKILVNHFQTCPKAEDFHRGK